ncbi:MAG: hypothetical protein ACI9G1_005922, partial [Pirellulaceae bacterium]
MKYVTKTGLNFTGQPIFTQNSSSTNEVVDNCQFAVEKTPPEGKLVSLCCGKFVSIEQSFGQRTVREIPRNAATLHAQGAFGAEG